MTEPAFISEELLSWVWKVLLIIGGFVPIVATVLVWFQDNFEMPMSEAVRNSILTSPLIYSVFIGLIVASFAVQYFLGSPARRKHEIRRRAPVLVFIGPIVVLIISVLAWWQGGNSLTAVISEVAQKPFMLGSVAGLTVGGLILAFAMSVREEQERCFKVLVTLASVFLMFGGPTYLIYGLQAAKVPYLYSTLIGLASFVTGIVIFLRFVIKETRI
ncbi:MAG: hypothetical protein JSV29_05560 [Candidatus Bathyarchaeota archaeon]|nr:MAG: hypothetical protein JSV29_05560 [Candidatus Bathyarchaeota archaeon]